MKVRYRVPRRARGALTVYEVAGKIVPCCEAMARAWGRLIGFGVVGCPRSTNRDVNLAVSVSQANGQAVVEVVPVAFCPWCGEAVETYRAKVV